MLGSESSKGPVKNGLAPAVSNWGSVEVRNRMICKSDKTEGDGGTGVQENRRTVDRGNKQHPRTPMKVREAVHHRREQPRETSG